MRKIRGSKDLTTPIREEAPERMEVSARISLEAHERLAGIAKRDRYASVYQLASEVLENYR